MPKAVQQIVYLVVTPVLVILIAILAGLALVAVCIILVMRVKHSKALASSYHSTHIPLQKGLSSNQCLSEKDPDIIPSNKGTDRTTPSSNKTNIKQKHFTALCFYSKGFSKKVPGDFPNQSLDWKL